MQKGNCNSFKHTFCSRTNQHRSSSPSKIDLPPESKAFPKPLPHFIYMIHVTQNTFNYMYISRIALIYPRETMSTQINAEIRESWVRERERETTLPASTPNKNIHHFFLIQPCARLCVSITQGAGAHFAPAAETEQYSAPRRIRQTFRALAPPPKIAPARAARSAGAAVARRAIYSSVNVGVIRWHIIRRDARRHILGGAPARLRSNALRGPGGCSIGAAACRCIHLWCVWV